MAGTGSSSQWESIASASYVAGALRNVIPEQMDAMTGSARTCQPIFGERFIVAMAALAAIIVANSSPSSALAAVEEAVSAGTSVSDYQQSLFSFDLANDSTPEAVLGESVNLGDVSIPTAVWSLDSSTVHLQAIRSEVGTDLEEALGNKQTFADFWTEAISGSWANLYREFGPRPSSSLRLQAASCGGDSAERSNLEFCTISAGSIKNSSSSVDETSENSANGNVVAPDSSTIGTVGSNGSSAASQASQLLVEPDLSSPTPGVQFSRHHWWQVGQMDDPTTSVDDLDDPTQPSDDPIPIDDPITPVSDPIVVVYPIAPIVYGRPPFVYPVVPIGGIGPVLDPPPIFIAPPESPIPETSTWIMITLGFGMMFCMTYRSKFKSGIS